MDRRALLDRALVGSPLVLALARIVVPLVIVSSPELYAAPALAGSPESLRFVPEGLGFLARIEITPQLAHVLLVIALSSAATAALGWLSRASMAVLTVSAGVLFSLSQRGGAVLHDMHLFWLTALLAASPCDGAWSLDRWGEPRPERSRAYGVPLALARLLLGLVYLFPGLHKVRESGGAWISADNVIHHMQAKWLETGALPPVRIDHAPWLCALGAALVVAFELSFVVLAIVSKRTRMVALVAGLMFHVSTQLFFFIPFVSLWACYVVLLDGAWLERLDDRLRRSSKEPRESAPRPLPIAALVVGGALALAATVQGVRGQTQAWPVACYPTFAHLQGPTIPDVAVEIETAPDGATKTLTGRETRTRSQAEWGHVFRISGAYGDAPPIDALRAHARFVVASAGTDPATVIRARVYRVEIRTAPEAWNEPPPRGVLLAELTGPL